MKAITVTFQQQPSHDDFGKIVVSITNTAGVNPIGNNLQAWIDITGPDGNFLHEHGEAPDIDIVGVGNTDTLKIDIPTDDNGNFLKGSYGFHVDATATTGETADDDSADGIYNFCPASINRPTFKMSAFLDCNAKKLRFEDDTNYGSWQVDTRTITVVHPTIPGVDTPEPSTTTTDGLTIDLTHNNVVYVATLEVQMTDSIEDGDFTFVSDYSGSSMLEKRVTCDVYGCAWLSCYGKFIESFRTEAQRTGRPDTSPKYLDYLLLIGYMQAYTSYRQCGLDEEAAVYAEKIKAILGTCGCSNDTQITEIATL